jgi:hypothetical protein
MAIVDISDDNTAIKNITNEIKSKFPKVKMLAISADLLNGAESFAYSINFDAFLPIPFSKHGMYAKLITFLS